MHAYVHLGIAIVAEVIGTTLMRYSEGFTKLWPTVATLCCYAVAFWFLSQTLQYIPTGIAYAIWSGVGIVLISAAGWPEAGPASHRRNGTDLCWRTGDQPLF